MTNSRTLLTSLGAAAIAVGLGLTWADAPPPPTPALELPEAAPVLSGGGVITPGGAVSDDLFGEQLAPIPDPAAPLTDPPAADPATKPLLGALREDPPGPVKARVTSKQVTVKQVQRRARRISVGAPGQSWSFRALRRWRLFGDTPTAAWSPDGRRLAVNSAFNYLGSPSRGRVEVLDVAGGGRTVVHAGPGYHPLWLDNNRVAFGCSVYECRDEGAGLWLAGGPGGESKRLAEGTSVYHTMSAGPGRVLFWSGFPGYAGWRLFDSKTGDVKPSRARGRDSWKPPKRSEHVDQCPQESAGLAARADMRGVEVSWHGGPWSRVSDSAGFEVSWGRGGTVQPCVSPDGERIAHFIRANGEPTVAVLELEPG